MFEWICPVCNADNEWEHPDFGFCVVCRWQDDRVQLDDPDYFGGANALSLNAYRLQYALLGDQSTSSAVQESKEAYRNKRGDIYKRFADSKYSIDVESELNELDRWYLGKLMEISSRKSNAKETQEKPTGYF